MFQIQVIKNIMSIKVKSQEQLLCHNDVKKEFDDSPKDESRCGPLRKKRLPACLSILCPVCGGPAPDHVHFGGKKHCRNQKKTKKSKMKYFPQANVAIPAEHFFEGPLSNQSLHFVAGESLW